MRALKSLVMPSLLPLLFAGLALALPAAEPLIRENLPVLAEPDLRAPLSAEWKVVHGHYEARNGELVCAEKPEDKHVAVLWHLAGWNTGVIECEFRFDGARSLILGGDGQTAKGMAHIGRVVVTPKQISIAEDSVKPSRTLAKLAADLKPGVWHRLRFEWQGDRIALQVNGQTLQAGAPWLANPKTRSWIAVGGQTAALRALTVRGKP